MGRNAPMFNDQLSIKFEQWKRMEQLGLTRQQVLGLIEAAHLRLGSCRGEKM